MGWKAIVIILMAWALSFLVFTPSLDVLPYWVRYNEQLYQLTIIGWNLMFVFAFLKFGLGV